jgi:hypothetical protein
MKEGAAIGKIEPMMARLYFFYVKRDERRGILASRGLM